MYSKETNRSEFFTSMPGNQSSHLCLGDSWSSIHTDKDLHLPIKYFAKITVKDVLTGIPKSDLLDVTMAVIHSLD